MSRNPLPFEPRDFCVKLSASYYRIADKAYAPSSTSGREARYSGPGTGSFYFAEDVTTCEAERAPDAQCCLLQAQVAGDRFVDLVAAADAGHDLQESMVPSGSGGWEIARQVSNYLFEEGYAGIRYKSSKVDGVCVVVWKDRCPLEDDDFAVVVDYAADP